MQRHNNARYRYSVDLEPMEEGGFLATFPDVPEAIASGDTREAALHEARKALGVALRAALADGEDLPDPSGQGEPVDLLVADALKLAVIERFQQAEISRTELAHRLQRNEKEARRILDASHQTKPLALEDALAAMGMAATLALAPLDAATAA